MKQRWDKFWRWLNSIPHDPPRDEEAVKRRRWLRWLYSDP